MSTLVSQAQSFVSASKVKDVIIGVLVFYVALDLLMHCLVSGDRPGLFETLSRYSDNGNVILVILLALAFGGLAWWLAQRKTPKKPQQ